MDTPDYGHKSCRKWCRAPETTASFRTRSVANAEGQREHTVSWNRVKCSINVRRIASEKAYGLWTTFKVILGHFHGCRLIGHMRFLLVFHCKCISILHRFRDINTYLRKIRRHVTLTTPWGQFVITGLLRAGGKTPIPLVGKHGASGGLQPYSAGTDADVGLRCCCNFPLYFSKRVTCISYHFHVKSLVSYDTT